MWSSQQQKEPQSQTHGPGATCGQQTTLLGFFLILKYFVLEVNLKKNETKIFGHSSLVQNCDHTLCPTGAYVPEGLMTSCTWNYMSFTPSARSYTMLLFTFVFFIPLFIIILCYCSIFRAIRDTTRSVHERSPLQYVSEWSDSQHQVLFLTL